MSRAALSAQPLRSLCIVPVTARAGYSSRLRTFATFPDPTHPTNSQNDVPNRPKGNNNTLLWVAGGLAAAAGGYYYYYVDQADPHAQLKAEEERLRQKAEEFRDAGRATARDAARDCESKYDETKDKLAHARAEAGKTAEEARNAAVRQYERVVETAAGATHKVEETYDEAAKKAKEEALTWNQWLWSWFGYSQRKAEDAKREAAAKVADVAHKVESEAGKRT
ncbi:hypothetical protein GSI_03831 [Ganoderma sinense ZZ0214-1]|uniref:Uncharacterized protein n=1 Tax=Ganoderma sinense ZZ0214-1 TaxID=1077348 RepID=A0A2G8SK38_9APHY|nr:hypothetical protein GSI_03831 [Ganoderma sinense ZZ0214-1]